MDVSRPSSPEAPPQDLWSSILDSVSSSRSIPSKQVLLLGQPSTGKSSIASALLQKPISDEAKDDQRIDFALGYDFANVRDDADEENASGTTGMGGMVKGKGGEWEERTDGIMQVLRTICLKYGASLLYTTPLPATLQVLRQHALHLLFMPPAPSPGMTTEVQAPVRNIFPFTHKPNTLDRDHILVPAGWDSWGKIGVLRDGFDARLWNEAWERDLESDSASVEPGAKKLYAALVPDQGAKPTPLPPFNNPVPEQTFLSKHYDENAKKTDRDPRGAFKNPAEMAAGIVGPLGSSSFSLPNVERALSEMESAMGPAGASNLGASTAGRLGGRPLVGRTGSGLGTATSPTLASVRAPTSPNLGAPNSTSGQTQHEVLQNFFQSLLNTRDRTGATAAAAAVDNDATIGNVTYENFVKDLDPGDSFAATMIDIMVKELAERRIRPQTDRRFLSARTMKSLRQLATPVNQFHPHRIRSRRTLNSVIYPEMDDLDEDNFEFMLGEATEGVHMSSADLYDAMSIPWPRRNEDASSSVRTTVGPPSLRSPPASNRGPWTVLPAPSTVPVVTRQASVRRPFNNTRNIEFNNFTRRHRLAHREGMEGEGVTAESVTEPREDPWTTRATSSARRFFPPVAARRLRRTTERGGLPRNAVDISDGTSSGDDDALNTLTGDAHIFAPYITLPRNFSGFDPSVPPPRSA
ncbi:hypothetical protein H1R20_g7864, partial [Candolleomyces eurysporus]